MNKRRKTRHIISWLLVFLTAAGIGILIWMADFYFGVFSGPVLARSFEESGYYAMQSGSILSDIQKYMNNAGLPEDLFDFSHYRPALERKMRAQVYGRQDVVLELQKTSLMEDMLDQLDQKGIKTTLRADQGLLKLSNEVGDMFEEGTRVPGIVQWQQERQTFSKTAMTPMVILMVVNIMLGCVLYLIQSRKYKFFYYLAAGICLASIAGLAGNTLLLMTGADTGNPALTAELYQKEIFLTGVKISGGVFLLGAAVLLTGRVSKKSLNIR